MHRSNNSGASFCLVCQLLHRAEALTQLGDQIGRLGSLFALGGNNCLGGTGNEFLVAELGFQGTQELLRSFQFLGDALDLLLNIHKLTHGDIELGVSGGDGHHTVQRKRGGGLFGSDEFTGSLGVVTINLPQIGYLAKTREEFYKRLDYLMDLAKESLCVKRKVIQKLYDGGLFPYTKRYLKTLNNHFNTIGLCGMNECCLNFLGCDITTSKGKQFAEEILTHMRQRMSDYQEKTGELFNLEATPAESTSYRLARHDKEQYPDIITSGTTDPYYTNSSQLPVDYTTDIFEALDHQESLQTKYTGGTVFHTFVGEQIKDWKNCQNLVRTVFTNYKIPYLTISPVYSICPIHGYLSGEHFECPKCKAEKEKELKEKIKKLEEEKEKLISSTK